MLEGGGGRVGPDGVGAGHIVYAVKGAGQGSLQGNDVLDHCCGRVEVASGVLEKGQA